MKANPLFSSFFKAVYWLALNTFFGLVPVAIVLFLKIFVENVRYSPGKILQEGVFMFFCAALAASVMVDYIFSKTRYSKTLEFVFYAFPFLLLLATSLLFSQLFFAKPEGYRVANLAQMQTFTILMTGFYCLVLKTVLFLDESQSSKKES